MKWEIECKDGILKPKYRISVCISSFKETNGEKKIKMKFFCYAVFIEKKHPFLSNLHHHFVLE